MQVSSLKKVLVRHRGSGSVLDSTGFLAPGELQAPILHLLTPQGQTREIALSDVVAVYFVLDFEAPLGSLNGAHAGPRLPGLWVRVRGLGQRWEGILASDLLDLTQGVWLTPLRAAANCQRIFIPRAAVEKLEPVEVIRPARRRRSPIGVDRGREGSGQFDLFDPAGKENP